MMQMQRLTFSGLLMSIALILNRIELSSFFHFGGSVTLFSLVPLMVISLKYGYKWGALCGGVYGLLHLITTNLKFQGLNVVSIMASILLDYIVSYSIIGFVSFFYYRFMNFKFNISISVICVLMLRCIVHIISGILIWSSLKIEKFESFLSVMMFSIIYNISYMLPEMLINLLGLNLIKKILVKFNIIK